MFDIIDLDGSGTIEKEEFRQKFKDFGLKVGFNIVFHIIDSDFSSSLDKAEFERFYNAWHRIFFDQMDVDGNGSLSVSELYDYVPGLKSSQQTLMFARTVQFVQDVDDNSNGAMEYNEYEKLMKTYIDSFLMNRLNLKKYQRSNSESGYEDMFEETLKTLEDILETVSNMV